MRAIAFALDDNGDVQMSIQFGPDAHFCLDIEAAEFDHIASMVETVHLESKAARS